MEDLSIKKKADVAYGELVDDNEMQQFINDSEQLSMMMNGVKHQINSLNIISRNKENAIQRYLNTEFNNQLIQNNELNKYSDLIRQQNNLISRINDQEIQLSRYRDKIYYRTNSGQLIIDNNIEIQKELSSRYGPDVYIINDMNDILNINTQIRVNTVYITINALPVVDEEIVEPNTKQELILYANGTWKRNLLAYTRYTKERLLCSNHSETFTKKMMSSITERNSDCISPWIKNIGTEKDTILLLIGNKALSESLIIDKVIKRLFNTGIVVTLTDEMLQQQSFEDIIDGHLFYISSTSQMMYKTKKNSKSYLFQSLLIDQSYLMDIQFQLKLK